MLAGEPYNSLKDPELFADSRKAESLCAEMGGLRPHSEAFKRLQAELLPNADKSLFIRGPFYCDYGYNIFIGRKVYINYDCMMLDGARITIGDNVLIAPKVQFYTINHPLGHLDRRTGLEIAKPITVEDDCWIGGGCVICPGVTIGARSVIGAGSVVSRDIPPDSVAVGNPARVVRKIPS